MIWRQIILFGPGIILLSLVNHTVLATDKFSCLDEFPAVSNRAEFIKLTYYDRIVIHNKISRFQRSGGGHDGHRHPAVRHTAGCAGPANTDLVGRPAALTDARSREMRILTHS